MRKRHAWWIAAAVPVIGLLAAYWYLTRPPAPVVLGPVVQLRDGSVQGAVVSDLLVYRGIPFAAAPVGDLRWRAPAPVAPWTGVHRATRFKPACMQIGGPIPGLPAEPVNEDCLYLNLWTPRAAAKLPVMVWLHGGGGVNGSASTRFYWGDTLARNGVMVVSLSYRLGALGSLAHPELTQEAAYGASGNYALLDAVAGLRWVRDNIAAFGGDPDNVTLFGHSAGAWMAGKLMVSPLAEGLFDRVIGESGGDFGPAGTREGIKELADAERDGMTFASAMGAASIAELRRLPAATITAGPRPSTPDAHLFGLAVVDGYVLPRDAYELYRAGRQYKIPLLAGYTAAEGANMVAEQLNAPRFIAEVKERYGTLAPRFLAMYPATSDEEAHRSQVRLTGERAIAWQVATWARIHARTGSSNVYVYHFDHTPPVGPLKKLGAAHGAELTYVFGYPTNAMRYLFQMPWNARRDIEIANQLRTYWTNFARTGDPNSPALPAWPAFNPGQQVLAIGADTRPVPLTNRDEHELMDDYMDSLRASTQRTAGRSMLAPVDNACCVAF